MPVRSNDVAQERNQFNEFEAEVADRFGILPNFFRSAAAAPELIQELWGFAKAGYLDNPMPSVFKERLFVSLSRYCPMRYCIVRHVGFLLGGEHGHSAGDPAAAPEAIEDILLLLRRPSPWQRDMSEVYATLERGSAPIEVWPTAGSGMEDAIFACGAVMFVEPTRSERARRALEHAIGPRRFEFFSGCLAFIRTAHYWTMLHPEIETEEDMRRLLRGQQDLAQALLDDPEAGRCEMGERLFEELTDLRALHERQELAKAKDALEEKDRQKDQFIAVLGHELRNPLAAIRAATDAMGLLQLTDSRADRLLERLDRQTTAMTRMLDDLMDASRIALGKVSVQMESVDLRELLQDVLDEQEPRIRRSGLHLVSQLGSQHCLIKGDRVRLRQIVDNLLTNANKFTPSGGTIELVLAVVAERAVVTVRDSGVGFDSGFAAKLFEPFTQQEHSHDRPSGGLGLGLAIASRLAQLQGGSLSAASEGADKGATFTLSIPIAAESGDVTDANVPRRVSTRKSVLLVEDNRDVADSLADLLALGGFRVTVVNDGASALARALQLVPDLILCDLGLPGGMDGFAVARACRAEASLHAVRLIAASGYGSVQDHANAKEAGFDYLLTKPLTHKSLALIAQQMN